MLATLLPTPGLPGAAFASTQVSPTINGTPATSVKAGQAYSFTPAASSPRGAVLAFSIADKPVWAAFSATTGRLSGTPASTNAGTFANITISVNDGTASASLAPFAIKVLGPPTISGTPTTSVTAGNAYSFTPTTSNPSGGALAYSISNMPAWASFSKTTGRLSGAPSSASAGTYANITISVSNGTGLASLATFTITVRAATNASATLSWTAPTTRADGTRLTNLAGYRIYYGTSLGNYPNMITVANPSQTASVVANLRTGATYYFVETAYDTNGIESSDSIAVSKSM